MPPVITLVGGWLLHATPPRFEPPVSCIDRHVRAWNQWLSIATRPWSKDLQRVWKTVVFVGRYGAQSLDVVERWPLSKLARVSKYLQEYLKSEQAQGASPRGMSSRSGAW